MSLNPHWLDEEYDDVMYEAAQEWTQTIQRMINANGKGFPFEYMGYAASFQDPLGSYGVKSLDLMRAVSKKYDPDQVFQKLVPGGFKLSNAGHGG